MSLSIKINLSQLKHSRQMLNGKSGKVDCLIIPINENHLYAGDKGVYLDLSGLEIKDRSKLKPEQKNTHLVKQSYPTDYYSSLSEEEKKSIPILGNVVDWSKLRIEQEPQQSEDLSGVDVEDDLPF
ncbi:MAG: hypothetical protein ACRC76_12435 [Proteocatella sp.]